ncbi:hypothetical protein GFS60_00996 [Rhodococcus sp. WAY2]|nr:hypothetical protein GFS60_00996 [Rhodococcus sp. WAY2]
MHGGEDADSGIESVFGRHAARRQHRTQCRVGVKGRGDEGGPVDRACSECPVSMRVLGRPGAVRVDERPEAVHTGSTHRGLA